MAGDIYFNDVSLLLHCDGPNGSTTFTDSSSNNYTVTPSGDAQISTAQSKFGGASGLLDGTGDYLSIQSTDKFAFGTGDFTIELWIYINALGLSHLYESRATTEANRPVIYLDTNVIRYYNGSSNVIVSSTVSTGQWYHIAVTRNGTDTKLFINGTQEGSTYTDSINYGIGTGRPLIGAYNPAGAFFNGYIEEVRITKGVARYTSNFTPPTSAFSDYQPFISGTLTESLAATDFKARTYQLSDGALVSDTTVTSSPYTIELQTLEPVLVTMLPDYGTQWAASTAYALNDKVFPSDPATSPYYYECTTAGTSDASEPTWPISGTVNDGTAVWTYVEQMVQPITHGPLIPS